MNTIASKLFGKTGLRASELCMGTMTFGEAWGFGAGSSDVKKMFELYVEAGGNFFDTACNYQGGAAETALGELTSHDRDRFIIGTKYTMSTLPGDLNAWGNHKKNLRRSLEGSLRRLKTDYVDLLFVHLWDYTTPVPEVLSALDDLVRAGKVLHAAISDAPAWVVAQANTWAEARGRSPFAALQMEYSLLERSVEHELLPMARAFDLPVLAWSPLAFGVLSGKFHDGTRNSRRGEWANGYLGERADAVVPVVLDVAKELGVSAAATALAWVRSRGADVFPIIGARTPEQLRDNIGSLAVALSPEQRARLDAVSELAPTFPAKMWANTLVIDGVLTGGTAADLRGWERPR